MKAGKSDFSSPSQIASVTSLMICRVSGKEIRPEMLSTGARVKPFYPDQEKREGCQGQGPVSFEEERTPHLNMRNEALSLGRLKGRPSIEGKEVYYTEAWRSEKNRTHLKTIKYCTLGQLIHHNNVPYILKT